MRRITVLWLCLILILNLSITFCEDSHKIIEKTTDIDFIYSNPPINIFKEGFEQEYLLGNVTQITNNSVGDLYPLISDNGHIAYTAEINGTIEIFLWNGTDNIRLTNNDYNDDFYFSQNMNQINDKGQFVWHGKPMGNFEIYFWNGSEVFRLTNNAVHDYYPTINNTGWITWEATSFNGSDSEIVLLNGNERNEIIQISDNTYNDAYPQIGDNGNIFWVGETGPTSYYDEIFLWDGNKTIQLTNNLVRDCFPCINDIGQAVWQGYPENGDWEIYFWNGTEVIQLTNNDDYDYSPGINDNGEIVWVNKYYDNNNATEVVSVMYYDGYNTSIISSHIDQRCPEINNNGQVVWFRFEKDNTSFQSCEVYYWDGGLPIRLTNNSYYDINPEINNLGQVVWSGFDGYDEEIFTTTIEPKVEYAENLEEGWNLISLPLEQTNESIDKVLSSIAGKWDCIRTFDALTGIWKSNITDRPSQLNDFDALNHQQAFWINITEPGGTILTVSGYDPPSKSIPLYAGWNLIGYPSLTNETVANALWGTGADRIEVFDELEPYQIKEVGPTFIMKPGEGYWVHVPADTTWIINW